jgi:DNA-binding HxlR family transcriptional regulator
MSMAKAASTRHSELLAECPVPEAEMRAFLRAVLTEANRHDKGVMGYLDDLSGEDQAAWIAGVMRACQTVFQPWMIEILYVLAIKKRARFTELQNLLGLSSRTLSDKLKVLRVEGFVDREVFDEQPVRIEYFLTKHGSKTAAFVTPLTSYLNFARREAAKGPRATTA